MLKDELVYEEIIPGLLRFLSDQSEREWIKDAACRGMDTNWWYPERGENVQANKAAAICKTCPVQAECLEYGKLDKHGIWGGLAQKQRRKLER